MSALTENLVVAAVLGVASTVILYFLPFLGLVVPNTGLASYIGFVVLALVAAGIAFLTTHNLNVTAITGAVAVVPLSVVYILSRSSFEGLFPSLLRFISPFAHFATFCQFGTFSVQSLILLLSYPVLFVFLTVQSADKKRWD
jgi:ABC-2 type transport system permease protein